MATKEDILISKTHKDVSDVAKRVFYTLLGEEGEGRKLQAHRNSKAIALLFKTLREIGTLTDERIDKILLSVLDYGND
jgi:hypothetical protein